MNVTTNIIADVARPNVLPMIWAKAGDSNSRYLNITVAANGIAQAIPPAANVRFNARRFDGQAKSFNGSVSDGVASITLPDWLLEIDGLADCSVTIKVDDSVLTTLDFQIYVQAAQTNNLEKTVYYVTSMLVPGEYYLFIGNLPYSFTLTGTVPAGAVIAFDSTNTSATVYQNESRTSIVESGIVVTQQAGGTLLTTYYDVSDATAVADDIMQGKTAYIASGKTIGTYILPLPKLVDGTQINLTAKDLHGATSIGDYAFYYNRNLTSIELPNSVTSIGYLAFYYCSNLENILIPDGVTQIARYAFQYCTKLASLVIPESITVIEQYICQYCSGLRNVTLPSSITTIRQGAFDNLYGISIIINAVTPPTLEARSAFSSGAQIYVPAESVDAYKTATNWSYHASRIVAIQK